jgi:MFS family permease
METEGSAMSQEYAWPAAWRREGEAGETAARRREAGLGDVGLALALAGFPQAFDFAACGVLAASVLPQVFFPGLAPAAALAASLSVWMLAYVAAWVARPAVAAVDRICDPRLRLILARALFTASTMTIALLPASARAAWAPGLFVAARLVQGLGLAGLSHGRLAPQLSPAEERRGRLKVWAVSGAIGLVVAGGLAGVLALVLQGPDLVAWGWRYPFVIALALNISGLVGDLNAESVGRARRPKGRAQIRLATVFGAPVDAGRG